ncbi:hypothetical protein [Colwellia hornerae]|uniref:BIG2 domain-containing protein n=1 Tax=Colwellia hornerae TaxID=89402 RepID=A0A5C6QRC4_9GAMM|nr:hypothetical protein [Colwellia hornerae]TWX55678.1 hypothetical protein ESZ28_05765 [Colwellia hornerae]TWX61888.1 hypothetical protein ESZ26_04540 [Colwellia hornerae]TWX71220.1 hypothetical protein ESZ27_02120 [Colwellia hornerae]
MHILRIISLLTVSLFLMSCGGGGESNSSNTVAFVESLKLEASSLSNPKGRFFDITAEVRLSDGTKQSDALITNWVASDPSIVTITKLTDRSVRINTNNTGSVEITATHRGVSASVSLTITPAEIENVVVELRLRLRDSIAKGANFEIHAIGMSTDHLAVDLTNQVQWSTSESQILQIIEVNDIVNLKGENFGTANVVATFEGIDYIKEFTVSKIQALATKVENFGAFDSAIGEDGLQYSAWFENNFSLDDKLKLAIYNDSLELIDETTMFDNTDGLGIRVLKVAANSGLNSPTQAIVAYTTIDGLYVTTRTNSNWSAPITMASGNTGRQSISEAIELKLDESGNALLLWEFNSQGYYSVYSNETRNWSEAAQIPLLDFMHAYPKFSLTLNNNGQGIVLWQSWDDNTRWHLYSTMINISNPEQTSWSEQILIDSHRLGIEYDVALSNQGQILLAYDSEDELIRVVKYSSETGWGLPIIVSDNNEQRGSSPKIILNDNENAAVFWHNSYNTQLRVARFQPSIGWLTPENIDNPTESGPATPQWLAFKFTNDNKILAQLYFIGVIPLEVSFTESNSWQTSKLEDIAWSAKGTRVSLAETEMNNEGSGMMFWIESYTVYEDDGSNGTLSDLYIAPFRFEQ